MVDELKILGKMLVIGIVGGAIVIVVDWLGGWKEEDEE